MTTQPQDKMRAEFEALPEFVNDPGLLYRGERGGYIYTRVAGMWDGWQAACAQQSGQASQTLYDKPLVVRLAEDFAEDCILVGYVSTGAWSHAKLMAAAQEDALDAARYRWLRDGSSTRDGMTDCQAVARLVGFTQFPTLTMENRVHNPDSAIDALIAAQGASNV